MLKLFLLFTLVPTIELFLLMRLGALIGPLNTVLVVLITGSIGAFLAKREGLTVLRSLSDELSQGIPPAARLAEAALVVVGGVLLITPGVLTDLAGFSFIFPPTRRFLAPRLIHWISQRFTFKSMGGSSPPSQSADSPPSSNKHFDHPVV